MDFVMLNLNKIINLFNRLDTLYHNTLLLKKIYKIVLSHIAKKNNILISDFSMDIGIEPTINRITFIQNQTSSNLNLLIRCS